MPSSALTIQITARRAAWLLCTTAATLILANLCVIYVRVGLGHGRLLGINRLFDLDGEANLPALFSTALFFLNATLLYLVSRVTEASRDRFCQRCWVLLAGLFCFLGVDEAVSIHETLVDLIHERVTTTTGVFHFAWVIPYGAATALLAGLLIPWFTKLDVGTRWLFAGAAVLFLSGALGMEMIGGRYLESVHDRKNLLYLLMTTLEETLEMSGQILFTYSLICLIENHGGVAARVVVPAAERKQRSPTATDSVQFSDSRPR